jgi:predicted metal-dependent hydrolase
VSTAYLVEGVRLFEDGQYFLSHETLEEHWAEAPEQDRNFYQGLIHLAVGFLHHGKGNDKGSRLQFTKASKRLSGYPDVYQQIDVARVREFLDAAPAALDRGETLTPPKLFRPTG